MGYLGDPAPKWVGIRTGVTAVMEWFWPAPVWVHTVLVMGFPSTTQKKPAGGKQMGVGGDRRRKLRKTVKDSLTALVELTSVF